MTTTCCITLPVLCLGLMACDSDPPRVGPVERFAIAQWFEKEARRPPAEPCERSVLRGKPRAGSGTSKLAAVFDKDVAPGCKFKDDDDRLFHQVILADIRPGHTMLSEWGHKRRVSRAATHPLNADARIAGLAKACRPLIKRLRKAVQHGSACAPFRTGWKGPADVTPMWALVAALRYEARLKIRAGDTTGAFELLADGIRFTQDLGRGGAPPAQYLWGVVNGKILAREIEALLNTHRPLSSALLAKMQGELKQLMDSEPGRHVWLPAALLDLGINEFLPKAMPDGWVPPGGWGYEGAAIADGGNSDEAALGALAIVPLIGRVRRACPKGSRVHDCVRALDALARKLVPGIKLTMEALRKRAEILESKGGDLRKLLVPYFQAMNIVGFRKYHLRTSSRAFYLGALRLRLAYRRLAETSHRCPNLSAFDRAPLKQLRNDLVTGKPFDLQELETGHLRIAWPKAAPSETKYKLLTVLRCPY